MKTLLRAYGLLFLTMTAVAVTSIDEKTLVKYADKVSQARTLLSLWKAM